MLGGRAESKAAWFRHVVGAHKSYKVQVNIKVTKQPAEHHMSEHNHRQKERENGKDISCSPPGLLSHEHFGAKMANDHAPVSTICHHIHLKICSPSLTLARLFHLSHFLSISSFLLQFLNRLLFPVRLPVTKLFWLLWFNNVFPWFECMCFRIPIH